MLTGIKIGAHVTTATTSIEVPVIQLKDAHGILIVAHRVIRIAVVDDPEIERVIVIADVPESGGHRRSTAEMRSADATGKLDAVRDENPLLLDFFLDRKVTKENDQSGVLQEKEDRKSLWKVSAET